MRPLNIMYLVSLFGFHLSLVLPSVEVLYNESFNAYMIRSRYFYLCRLIVALCFPLFILSSYYCNNHAADIYAI